MIDYQTKATKYIYNFCWNAVQPLSASGERWIPMPFNDWLLPRLLIPPIPRNQKLVLETL